MPAQYVKPYVKTNKNDYIDAEAIAEAVGRANMRFVPIKSDEQLDMQSLHRVRDRWVARRTSVINQIRGLLLERGITFRKGRRHAEASLPAILEDADNQLSGLLRMLLAQLQGELRQLQSQIDEADALIAKSSHRARTLPSSDGDSRRWTADGDGGRSFHRQRQRVSQGAIVCSLAGAGAEAGVHRRQTEAAEHQQAWQPLPAQTLCERSPRRAAVQGQAITWSQRMAGPACIASSHQRRRCGAGQQDGSRRLGGAGQKRALSASAGR